MHLGLDADAPKGVLEQVKGVEKHYFSGPHPAGNVGVQIHHVDPISKGEIVWTVDIQNVALIGRFFRTGRVDLRKIVALTGSEILEPRYYEVISGAPFRASYARPMCATRPTGTVTGSSAATC